MQAALQPALIPARPYHATSDDVISPMPAVLCTTGLSPSPPSGNNNRLWNKVVPTEMMAATCVHW